MEVRALRAGELEALVSHFVRHRAQNGLKGFYYDPYESDERIDVEATLREWQRRIILPSHRPGWQRFWVAVAGTRIVGHVDLRCREPNTAAHRALLGLGVEATHRRLGLGRALMEAAIAWARKEPHLCWVDLGVFGHNRPAIQLYEELGFVRTGVVRDLFRIHRRSVDDIQMTLDVS